MSSSSSSSSSVNERLSQDTLYQDYRYLVGVYNNQYLEILRQIDDLRQEALVVRDIINTTTLDMRRRMRELTFPSAPGATMNPVTAAAHANHEDEVLQTFFNAITGYSAASASSVGIGTMDWRGMTAQRPTTIPSTRQINQAVRVIRYGDLGERETHERCPISWATFGDEDRVSQIIHCGHVFNTSELSRWFLTNARCPLCRHDIRDMRSGYIGATGEAGVSAAIHDVSGNLMEEDTITITNWANGLN